MGHIYREASDFDQAVARYTQSINLYETFPEFTTHLYHAHKGRFFCYLKQQNDPLTQAELSILFDLMNKYRHQISHEDSRNTFFDVEQSVVDAAIDFEYSRMNNRDKAFNYSNSSRARSLLDMLNADPDIRARVQNADIKFRAVAEPRSLETVKQELPEQAQVVQYVVLEDKLLIFVISRNNFRDTTQPISKRDLNEKLRRFLNIVSRLPEDDESEELLLAKDLYSILIKPVETLLDKQKVLCIVPDGTLSYLPFAALISPESGKYLIEDRLLMTSPSPSVFLTCWENALKKTGSKEEIVLSVGNPTFDRAAFPDFDDLPEAGNEAIEVSKLYKPLRLPLTENLATRAAVMRNIENSDVIHLALHSQVDDEVPLRSKLLLAATPKTPALAQASDSVISAYEIYNLKLSQTRLVVLSSCQSGAGRYYGGEGVSSLARAFMGAGVPLVVASLWPVQSNATEKLMVNFHSHRTQERLSTVEALRRAQQQMARGPAENLRRPYYWAAFTVTGGYAAF
jgi:CHAT domain-containing protein